MKDGPFVQDGDVAIRRMRDDQPDYLLLSRWLTDERVLEFYEGRDNPFDITRVREKFGPRAMGESRVMPCILLYENRAIGYIQYLALNEDEGKINLLESIEGVFGVDVFIGEVDYWNRGIGTRMVSALVHYLFDVLGARRVVIDPLMSNHRTIRCYEKCGFRILKALPRHELHEGEYRDCWLMVVDRLEVATTSAS